MFIDSTRVSREESKETSGEVRVQTQKRRTQVPIYQTQGASVECPRGYPKSSPAFPSLVEVGTVGAGDGDPTGRCGGG